MVYEWRIPKYTLPAQAAGEELERIGRKHGIVTPSCVLEESRTRSAVLHELFEWDDSAAAERYRLEQAREIIGNLVVVRLLEEQPQEPVRAFVNLVDTEQKRGYVSIVEALSSQDYTRQMLRAALAEFLALREKYGMLAELAALFQEIDSLHSRYADS